MRHTALVLAAALAVASPAAADAEHGTLSPAPELGHVDGASALEGKLLAPCCWNQTLDIHGSETALELRREIRRRLSAGEKPDAVQADIVARYGERILAVPPGSPLASLALWMSLGMGVAGVGAVWLLTRWRKRRLEADAERKAQTKDAKQRDRFDDQLDAELDQL